MWQIAKTRKLAKYTQNLPVRTRERLYALLDVLQEEGPMQPGWPNFGKLISIAAYHCDLRKGKPTYVACWCVIDKANKIIEVFYVGTHENAPY